MELKPEVLICIDWFLPGYRAGGPIKSVANIVNSLKGSFNFSIVCGNTDFGDDTPYDGIKSNCWIQVSGYRVMYLDREHQSLKQFREILKSTKYDVLYLNSLFSTRFTFFPLLAHKLSANKAKVVLAPRGMLGEGALALKKQKKKIFLSFVKATGLFKNVVWHASTIYEVNEIRVVFGANTQVEIATNISTAISDTFNPKVKSPDNTTFFFLSRISPKKNLLAALQMLTKLDLTNQVSFKIIGPVEDAAYWDKCQKQIALLPQNIVVDYIGSVPNSLLPTYLNSYHFMVLPTLNENYGHVVVEAWEAGCPVILSDQTPWRNLIEDKVGWDIPLNNEKQYLDVLRKCVLMEQEEFSSFGGHIKKYLQSKVVTDEIIEQNKTLFSV
ncbi:glycosyltransferase family 4 protein [Pontibacter sp. H249]|uniref:glycosyltransferase family 4 protein n=1 Tax=Pontibacter sp. H249 TaxID=3133420 RepID=UPI0030BC9EC7